MSMELFSCMIDLVSNISYPADLPIVAHRQQIITAIEEQSVVVIAGETGSGKTTQIPKMCLEAGRGRRRLIGCTQPRRIAAVTIAARVTEELGDFGPALIGYKIRFQDRTRKSNRVRFMTDGVLLAEAERDRQLKAYDTIIIDEAHERSLNIDFLLGMLKRMLSRRPDLKLIITSATIDTEKFAKHFGGATVINIAGRSYPVEVRYRPLPENLEEQDAGYVDQSVLAVLEIRKLDKPGDILVFMPTERDVRDVVDSLVNAIKEEDPRLCHHPWPARTEVLPLFGRLAGADQGRIFQPVVGTKIVVSTNVAETSVTVPGIRYVVDTGLARIPFYNVRARTTRMPVSPIARASADQRLGRCGRVGPGVCVRLYSEADYLHRPEYTLPEIQRSNLAEVLLRMMSLALGNPTGFPFVDPPAVRAIRDGYNLLAELGAIDGQRRLTNKGRLMARLPLDPRMARMIIAAREENALQEVLVIVAALSIQDPLVRPADREAEADAAHALFMSPSSDFLTLLAIWTALQNMLGKTGSWGKVRKFCKTNFLSYQRLREWYEVHEQLSDIVKEEKGYSQNVLPAGADAIHRAILNGNLRNIALKKEKNIYQGAQGREIMIFPGSSLFNRGKQWLMAADLVETTRLYARTVAVIEQEWLEPIAGNLCRSSYSSPHWEKRRGQVAALEKVTLFGLVIVAGRKVNYGRIDPVEARRIFIADALVNAELDGHFPFLNRNRALISKLEGMEDRLRQRDIVVDEQAIYQFYDQRLPAEVWDRAGLARLLAARATDKFLVMTEADLLNREPAEDLLAAFPENLVAGESQLPLSYRFEPGTEDDGVSVTIPVALAGHLDPGRFEWLVPGLLLDKIVLLLKGLPKALRKQLIPIPDTAQLLYKELPFGRGSLLRELERLIERRFGVRIEQRDWPLAGIPEHLRMRFCLVDTSGAIIKSTRRFAEFLSIPRAADTSAELALLRKKWERPGITTWDFAGLPERIPILTTSGGVLRGYAFPALTPDDNGSGVAIYLVTDEAEARELTRKGLLQLYLLHFNKVRSLRQDFALPRSEWALYEGMAGHAQFNQDLLTFIFMELFGIRDGRIPAKELFARTIADIQAEGLYNRGIKIFTSVKELLVERRLTLDLIARYETMPNQTLSPDLFTIFRDQVNEILPLTFLREMDFDYMRGSGRYLRGLRIRVERAYNAPQKDADKAALVALYEQRLADCRGVGDIRSGHGALAYRRLLNEYRQMIDEYKLSLFAQEIKTAFPVSAKRLEEKWLELDRTVQSAT